MDAPRRAANQRRSFHGTAPPLRPQPKTATRSGVARVDWIIDLVAGLESRPLSLRTTSLQLDSFPTSCPPSIPSRIVSFLSQIVHLGQNTQQSSSSRNRALLTALIASFSVSLSHLSLLNCHPTSSCCDFAISLTFVALTVTSTHILIHESLNGPAPVPRLSKPLVFHLFPLATVLSNTTETPT